MKRAVLAGALSALALAGVGSALHAAEGDWPVKPSPPFIPGHEGYGTVVALGPGVDDLAVGDKVGKERMLVFALAALAVGDQAAIHLTADAEM